MILLHNSQSLLKSGTLRRTKKVLSNTHLVQMQEYGGNVVKDTVGERRSIVDRKEVVDVHIVVIKKYLQDIMTYSPQIQN